jgi:phosphoglycolate phosphatase-like HAD superfamily hydrolase
MKNKELGLPYSEDGMEKVLVAFDVDGTLIDGDKVHMNTVALMDFFAKQNWKNVDVIVWSGGGADYARTMMDRITGPYAEFNVKYHSKLEYQELRKKYDKVIAFDDIQDTRLGDVNLIVRNK